MPESRMPAEKKTPTPKGPRQPSRAHREEEIDEALKDSFPASDPPSYATPHKVVGPQADGTLDNDKVGVGKKRKAVPERRT